MRRRRSFLTDLLLPATMQLDHRLIVALDMTDGGPARSVTRAVRDRIDAVKVGWPLVLGAGVGIVRELAELADVPNTSRLVVEQAVGAGASGVICHGFAGEDSVRACVEAAGRADVFVVTELSHPGGLEYTAKLAEDFARLAVRAGAAGIIAPATRPDRVRALRSIVGRRLLLSPGVGAQGGNASKAISAGADAVIVGRAIYESSDPAGAARTIEEEIRAARSV